MGTPKTTDVAGYLAGWATEEIGHQGGTVGASVLVLAAQRLLGGIPLGERDDGWVAAQQRLCGAAIALRRELGEDSLTDAVLWAEAEQSG